MADSGPPRPVKDYAELEGHISDEQLRKAGMKRVDGSGRYLGGPKQQNHKCVWQYPPRSRGSRVVQVANRPRECLAVISLFPQTSFPVALPCEGCGHCQDRYKPVWSLAERAFAPVEPVCRVRHVRAWRRTEGAVHGTRARASQNEPVEIASASAGTGAGSCFGFRAKEIAAGQPSSPLQSVSEKTTTTHLNQTGM
jgi:hypothetical protein